MGNENLHAAKRAKNDEFYTRYADIEAECRHYAQYFKGKTIFCPCDDAIWSQFAAYFAHNFQVLGLRRLICSCFYEPQGDLFTPADPKKRGYWTCYDGQMPADKWLNNPQRNYFKGYHGGDFRSAEVTELLKQSDFVVTNPPFSLWREFFDWVKNKKFLIIGTMQSVTYKNVFPYFKNEKLFLGSGGVRANIEFELPKNASFFSENVKIKNGVPFIKLSNTCWFQNIFRHAPCKPPLVLTKSYYADPSKYPKFDNYDAINVDSVRDIPFDYFGEMGVPINFIDNYFASGFVAAEFKALGIPQTLPFSKNTRMQILKNGEPTGDYTINAKANFYRIFDPKIDEKPQFLGDDGTLYCVDFQRVIIQRADSQKKSALTVDFEVLENNFAPLGAQWCKNYFENGGTGHYTPETLGLSLYENGKSRRAFERIIIRRRAVPLFAKNG